MAVDDLVALRENRHEIVLFKPVGISSEFRNDRQGRSVKSFVSRHYPGSDPKLPHRLDRITRGILVVCLTPEAIVFQNKQIKERRWEKYYLARVAVAEGRAPEEFLGVHKAYLKESGGKAYLARSGGKPAWLEILGATPVPGNHRRWHLLIRLLTGRFHQIRAMCAAMGLPLPGDPLYDPAGRNPSEFYLEHIVLKYTPFDTQKPTTLFLPDLPERGTLAPELSELISSLVQRAPLFSEVSSGIS